MLLSRQDKNPPHAVFSYLTFPELPTPGLRISRKGEFRCRDRRQCLAWRLLGVSAQTDGGRLLLGVSNDEESCKVYVVCKLVYVLVREGLPRTEIHSMVGSTNEGLSLGQVLIVCLSSFSAQCAAVCFLLAFSAHDRKHSFFLSLAVFALFANSCVSFERPFVRRPSVHPTPKLPTVR